ncbi:hypothetical protein F8M41_025565 [Gigaspora margarita]|uniref:Deoxynucleoside kinase domain-containing protein n=1 Tax=Gigaspora margarita TaxID=4874 RepID=A0A8H4ET59_GIGMA|nr:hypothetical protein F8M41_025565 [Gigaspora margarita]
MRKTVNLIVIDNEGEELKIDKPEKRIIKQLSKLPLSKLLDLQDISELPFDQYQITKNTLFYIKQQQKLKLQNFLSEGIEKRNLNIGNTFHDHFNAYFDKVKTHATLVAGGGAIAVGKTTWLRRLKLYLMDLGCQVFLPQEITLKHNPLLELMYLDIEKYSFMFQQFVIQQFEINYRKIKQLETEGKIGPNSWILFDRSKNNFWPFTWTNIKNPKELEELTRFYNAISASFDIYDEFHYQLLFECEKDTMHQRCKARGRPEESNIPTEYLDQIWDIYHIRIKEIYPKFIRIPTDIREPDHMIRSLFIHEAKFENLRIKEMTITDEMRNYINNLPITGYTLITPFKFNNSEYQVLAARRSKTTKVYAQQYSYFGGKKKITDKTYRDCVKREALEELKLKKMRNF